MKQKQIILSYQKIFVFLIIAVLLLTPIKIEAQIQWITNGSAIASATASPINITSVPDGSGGVFIAYEDNPLGDIDIYAQWIDGSGNLKWGSTGIAVNASAGDQKFPSIVPDDAGGVFIAWHDASDIKAQHINNNGALLWQTQGKYICSAAGEQSVVKAVTDGSGGVILVWIDKRSGTYSDIYAQRLNYSGDFLWTSNGIPVTSASYDQHSHTIIGDGSGGVFVVWQDYRNEQINSDIYAQRLTSLGTQAWTTNGIAVVTQNNNQSSPEIDTSGNKLIITWEDYRSVPNNIYTQALDFNGTPLWTVNGKPLSTTSRIKYSSCISGDGTGGAIIAWWEIISDYDYDIYAQRVNNNGNLLWTSEGIAVNQFSGYQFIPEIITDGSEGAIIIWNDARNVSDYDIYGQRLNGEGTLLWQEDGLPIVSETGNQENHVIISDESGGAIILWQDSRNGKSDIYGQLTNDNLSFTIPPSGALWAGDRPQTIEWNLRTSQTRFDHLTLRASSSLGDGFPHIISQEVDPVQYTESWIPETINSSTVKIKIQAHNTQGIVLCEYQSEEFTIDSDPPEVFNLLLPSDGAVVDLQTTFQWESTTDNLSGFDHFELWIGESLIEDNIQTTSHTLTESQKLTSGQHTWTVKAIDIAGLVRQASSTRTLTATEDQIPPNPFNLLLPNDNIWTTVTTPTFTWEATTDIGTGLKKYQLYINDQLLIDNIPPSMTSVSSLALIPGHYSWYVVALDSTANPRQSNKKHIIKIDNVPPDDFPLIQPAHNQWIPDSTPTFTWQTTSDTGIGLSKYQLWIDNNLSIDDISAGSSSITLPEYQALEQGAHTWYIVAEDTLGNKRLSQNNFAVGIDITLPQSYNLILPENGSCITQPSPDFTWQSTTDNVSGLKEYELWIDGSLNVDALSTTTSPPSSPLVEGSHDWTVRAIDNAGNIATSSTFNFITDWTPPESFDLILPSDGEILHINRPTFAWHSTNDPVSGLDKFQLFLDGFIMQDNLSAEDTIITLSDPLENGIHSWKVWAWDKSGNNRVSDTFSFTVECNPPEITSPETADAEEDIPFIYIATATDPEEGDELTISFEDYPTWLSPSGNQISGTPGEGIQDTSFVVVVTDGIYTESQKVTLFVEGVNDPPEFSSPSSEISTEDIFFSYTAIAVDPENDPLIYTFEQYPTWLDTDGNQISGTPTEGKQDTSFLVIVTDGLLYDSLTVLLTVTAVNDKPEITSPNSVDVIEDSLLTYIATAVDAEGDDLSFDFIQHPTWLTHLDSLISGIPTEGKQDTSFLVIATDGSSSDTLEVAITVTAVNDPPQITSPSSAKGTEDTPFLYTATATDPEKDELTINFEQYPDWLTVSEHQIGGTPPEGTINGSFLVIVSDGLISDSLEVVITITAVNDQPVITSPNAAESKEDSTFTYTASADDPDGDELNFIYNQYPTWLTPSGRQISGIPTEGKKDTSFLVIVSDGSLTDTLMVVLTVQPVNDPPEITSTNSASATEDILFTYSASAVDPDGDVLSFSFSQHPTWLEQTGNQISGIPTNGKQDTSFTVVVSDGSLTDILIVTLTISPVNDPPVITSLDNVTAIEDITFTYTAEASDPEGDDLTFIYQNYPGWMTYSDSQISGVAVNGTPDTCFTLIASDGSLTDTQRVEVHIMAVNDAPEIISSDTAYAAENKLFNYIATAVDQDGPYVVIKYIDYPKWLQFFGQEIRGTPPNGCQDTTFKIIAFDGFLSDTLNVTLIVEEVNDPPRFDYSFSQISFNSIDTLIMQLELDNYVSDRDDPDNLLSWSYTVTPDTLDITITIDTETHTAIVTGANIKCSFSIAFTVTDPRGASATDTLRVKIITTGIEHKQIAEAPSDFILHDNYPNPFNPATTIRYGIPYPCRVTLRIYNMLGNEITTLVDDEHKPGTYEYLWDASSLPSGVYFYRIQAKKWQTVKKMILMK